MKDHSDDSARQGLPRRVWIVRFVLEVLLEGSSARLRNFGEEIVGNITNSRFMFAMKR